MNDLRKQNDLKQLLCVIGRILFVAYVACHICCRFCRVALSPLHWFKPVKTYFFQQSYGTRYLSENKALRQIQFSRHRTELMHRISQMNRAKTKEFLNDFFLPSFDEDFSDVVAKGSEVRMSFITLCSKLQ